MTKILPNIRVNFLVRFALKPLFYRVTTSNCSENSLVPFVRFFAFAGPFLPFDQKGKRFASSSQNSKENPGDLEVVGGGANLILTQTWFVGNSRPGS